MVGSSAIKAISLVDSLLSMVDGKWSWVITCHYLRAAELHSPERRVQIGYYVFYVFNSYGDSHEAIGNSEPRALSRRNRRVSHRRRVRDQCFNAAQTFGQRAEAHIIQHCARSRKRPCLKGDHSSESRHQSLRPLVLRMTRQTGIVNLFDLRMVVEEGGHFAAVVVMLFHSHRQSLGPAGGQPCVERRD